MVTGIAIASSFSEQAGRWRDHRTRRPAFGVVWLRLVRTLRQGKTRGERTLSRAASRARQATVMPGQPRELGDIVFAHAHATTDAGRGRCAQGDVAFVLMASGRRHSAAPHLVEGDCERGVMTPLSMRHHRSPRHLIVPDRPTRCIFSGLSERETAAEVGRTTVGDEKFMSRDLDASGARSTLLRASPAGTRRQTIFEGCFEGEQPR